MLYESFDWSECEDELETFNREGLTRKFIIAREIGRSEPGDSLWPTALER